MQISRSNYEIWLIDWLDGNLTDLQVNRIRLFLSENPDLKKEFDELPEVSLKPPDKSFSHKDHLKKSPSDLSISQFEYMCVACLENDLSSVQQTELKEIIDQNPEKKKTFEFIQEIRLSPAVVSYKHKNKLIKKTPVQKVILLSAIGLSAAATIALVIMTNLIIPRNLTDITNATTQNILIDSSFQKSPIKIVSVKITTENEPVTTEKQNGKLFAGVLKTVSEITEPEVIITVQPDSLIRNFNHPEAVLNKIPVYADIDLKRGINSNTLVASNSGFIMSQFDDERSNFKRFIAKTFREKILRETIIKDSPLKAYEIAEAGVTGLNKLLGWEMALDKYTDGNGELRSVYFSSKLLKFNAPVKKTEPVL